jgi:hypothetical protein
VSSAIPAGVPCGCCGRLHLPGRLRPIDRGDRSSSGTDCGPVTRCTRCRAVGPLRIDDTDPAQVAIRDAIAANAAAGTSNPSDR